MTIHGNRMPWVVAGTFPFNKDVWELYNVNEDFVRNKGSRGQQSAESSRS